LPEAEYGRPDTDGEKGTWRCKILAPSREAHDAMVDALQGAGIDFTPGTPFSGPMELGVRGATIIILG
jgi:hypothetical protein